MEKKGIARFPKPVFHRIPNFIGAEKTAQKLRELPEYKVAKIVFCAPDSPQRPVRDGKWKRKHKFQLRNLDEWKKVKNAIDDFMAKVQT